MSPATTSPINRTPWVEHILNPHTTQWSISTSLISLQVYQNRKPTESYLAITVQGRDGQIEFIEMPHLTVDAAKAEAIRMALRHLAAAIISL